jgi:glycine cleavage system H protein
MKFTPSHEWIHLENQIGTVGITGYAQKELGEIVHIELPKIGSIVKAGQEICVLESTKSATDIYSPVTGRIVAVNHALQSSPDLINHSPETDGWLYQIELSSMQEINQLLSRSQYDAMTFRDRPT